jgi:hypothetical protein
VEIERDALIIELGVVRRSARMDPVSLATSAATLLAPYLLRGLDQAAGGLADSLGDAALDKLRQLHQWLRAKVAGKPAEPALDRLERDPENERYRVAFEVELADLIEAESAARSGFAETLERLVAEARQAAGPAFNQVSDVGIVAGGDVTLRGRYVSGRDMQVRNPPPSDG